MGRIYWGERETKNEARTKNKQENQREKWEGLTGKKERKEMRQGEKKKQKNQREKWEGINGQKERQKMRQGQKRNTKIRERYGKHWGEREKKMRQGEKRNKKNQREKWEGLTGLEE